MKFSLLLASRERLDLLVNMLDSLLFTTVDCSLIEVLIGIDSDDKTYDIKKLEKKYSEINLKFFVRERSIWMHRDYINWLYKYSSGKYIIVLNDDTVFESLDWDVTGFKCLENYLSDKPDGIVYGFTENHSGSDMLCTFPLISRKAADVLGWVLPNERTSWGGDHDLYGIFTHKLVDRKLYVPDISIGHISIHTGKRERDEISYEIERSWMPSHNIYIPINHYAEKVSSYIREFYSNRKNKNLKVTCIYYDDFEKAKEILSNQNFSNWELVDRVNADRAKGDLIVYVSGNSILYENYLNVFVNYFKLNPDKKTVYGVIDLAKDGIYCGCSRNKCEHLVQICHKRELGNFDSLDNFPKDNFIDIKVGRANG